MVVARDPARANQCQAGYCRAGVYRDDWDKLLKAFEDKLGDCNVTYRQLRYGTRDITTGWRRKHHDDSTIKIIVIDRATTQIGLPVGVYIRLDAVGLTAGGVRTGGQIVRGGQHFELKGLRERKVGNSFWFRECDLTLL